MTHVVLGPKSAIDNDVKLHASKDKLYAIQTSFMVPKGSPLNASETNYYSILICFYCVTLTFYTESRGYLKFVSTKEGLY